MDPSSLFFLSAKGTKHSMWLRIVDVSLWLKWPVYNKVIITISRKASIFCHSLELFFIDFNLFIAEMRTLPVAKSWRAVKIQRASKKLTKPIVEIMDIAIHSSKASKAGTDCQYKGNVKINFSYRMTWWLSVFPIWGLWLYPPSTECTCSLLHLEHIVLFTSSTVS